MDIESIYSCSILSLFRWEPTESLLGDFDCIPASYPRPTKFPDNFGHFLLGNMDFAEVYNYGLPLDDGLVGGWLAFPEEDPIHLFHLYGPGIGYVIQTDCDVEVPANASLPGVTFKPVGYDSSNHGLYATVNVYFPGASIESKFDNGLGVWQKCRIGVKFTSMRLAYEFIVDEWHVVSGYNLIGATKGKVNLKHGHSMDHFAGEFMSQIGLKESFPHAGWMLEGLKLLFNPNISYPTTKGSSKFLLLC